MEMPTTETVHHLERPLCGDCDHGVVGGKPCERCGGTGYEERRKPKTLHAGKELKDSDASCYERARAKGLDTFTLIASDLSSPKTIAYWILENIETAPMHKLVDALQHALVMRATPNRKHAD